MDTYKAIESLLHVAEVAITQAENLRPTSDVTEWRTELAARVKAARLAIREAESAARQCVLELKER
jgi:hypothetical protein